MAGKMVGDRLLSFLLNYNLLSDGIVKLNVMGVLSIILVECNYIEYDF